MPDRWATPLFFSDTTFITYIYIFINNNFGIRKNQYHLIDTFKSFYNKSGLRKKFGGQKMELHNNPALREQVPLNLT